ncbi:MULTISPECIES: hypothetical protein [unclassified Sphingomonas]|uniref:hypothetical protein n=1 Tax=unclassified Sphingomonas TaxID=196159 RepID=UPI000927BE43|nr:MULTISPECIES: hypothetical protein [unclassified Sphingomonas]MBN8849642.1 hypothetical protein [Sphingomonas sp.]OJV27695.1 MAG: hypothetical protein BGO24_06285 [Sphingomonas sp. 67-36]
MSRIQILLWAALTTTIFASIPAVAQSRDAQEEVQNQQLPSSRKAADLATLGRTADSAVGEVGQRQTRTQVAPNIEPLARIDSRIQNRVQNRIRNRIDRYYDPQANATSPFAVAVDQARKGSRSH